MPVGGEVTHLLERLHRSTITNAEDAARLPAAWRHPVPSPRVISVDADEQRTATLTYDLKVNDNDL